MQVASPSHSRVRKDLYRRTLLFESLGESIPFWDRFSLILPQLWRHHFSLLTPFLTEPAVHSTPQLSGGPAGLGGSRVPPMPRAEKRRAELVSPLLAAKVALHSPAETNRGKTATLVA